MKEAEFKNKLEIAENIKESHYAFLKMGVPRQPVIPDTL